MGPWEQQRSPIVFVHSIKAQHELKAQQGAICSLFVSRQIRVIAMYPHPLSTRNDTIRAKRAKDRITGKKRRHGGQEPRICDERFD